MPVDGLDRDELRSILSLYELGSLEYSTELPKTSSGSRYRVTAGGRRFLVRFTQKTRFPDLLFEKDLCQFLRDRGLPVPRIVENIAGGAFTPWADRGRYVWVTEDLGGRNLGMFEIRASHAHEIGRTLGRIHKSARPFDRQRESALTEEHVASVVTRIENGCARGRIAKRYRDDVILFRRVFNQISDHRFAPKRGVVHGDLSLSRARFDDTDLVAVDDFSQSCVDRYTWDIAIALLKWCWEPSREQRGGPSGRLDQKRMAALVAGYTSQRRLTLAEQADLVPELRRTALSLAVWYFVRFEVSRKKDGYRDYRHYRERLLALEDMDVDALIASG